MATLLGVRTKNHRNDVLKAGVSDATDDRGTPRYLFDPLHEEHGFTLDVAAATHNAKCARWFDLAADGLAQPWTGEVVWCNPPYSNLAAWVLKALYEVAHGCRKVVMLLPANRTEQRWWQEHVEPIRDRVGTGVTTRNLPGRPRFERAGEPIKKVGGRGGTHAPFGCVLLIIEPARAA
jgi:phage N-6-adenine-methyltransferase